VQTDGRIHVGIAPDMWMLVPDRAVAATLLWCPAPRDSRAVRARAATSNVETCAGCASDVGAQAVPAAGLPAT
jgi:hypothetical protein